MTRNINDLVIHLKETGFIYAGSEIYGGLANSWDYGPLGVALKNNIKKTWWKTFVDQNPLNVGLDSSIILNPKVWIASGHVNNFNDPLIECKICHHRFRADKLIAKHLPEMDLKGKSNSELQKIVNQHQLECTHCKAKDFSDIREFDLMFKTSIGPVMNERSTVYLRPETAQGIFINFKAVQRSMRKTLPFGIGQIGKSFRNEITPGNFIFRTREFEQMELEFFYNPADRTHWFDYWLNQINCFLRDQIKLKPSNFKSYVVPAKDLVHYSNKTIDIEYHFPFGWEELWGLTNRGDYDLKRHQEFSGEKIAILDSKTNQRIIPHVIEPSVGVERLMLALLWESFKIETLNKGDSRIVLNLPFSLAPYQIAVLPLQNQQKDMSWSLYTKLLEDGFAVTYDDKGNIGKRYRRQDAIGTPFAITIDFNSQADNEVTVRHRDTMNQERIAIVDLFAYLNNHLV